MLLNRGLWLSVLALVVGVALTSPVRAGEVDKYLPDDTEVVVNVNVKQILDSELFKKFGLDPAKQAIKDVEELGTALKELNFDPFTDLTHLTIGYPGGDDPEKLLIIAHGRFDVDKFAAKGEDAAKKNPDSLKIHKRASGPVIYELTLPNADGPMFVAIADKNTVLASPGKDYVIDGLKKIDNKQATVKNKEIQTLIGRMDAKQSLSIAMVGSALKGNGLGVIPKELAENLDAIGGGITVTDAVKLEIVVTTKTADAAKQMSDKINDGLNDALLGLGTLTKLDKGWQAALDVVKSVQTTQKDKTVTVKGEASADQLEKVVKAVQTLIGN